MMEQRTATRAAARQAGATERLEALVEAAAGVFARRGLRRTQMADVARAMGVSPGNLYNYVESKDALFHLVLRRLLGEHPGDESPPLPVASVDVTITADWVARRLDFVHDFPTLERSLARGGGRLDAAEVEAVVGELFDVLARMRLAVDVLERSAEDVPALAAAFGDVRRELFARYARWLREGSPPDALAGTDPEAVAHALVELCWWGAGRRPNDPHARGISESTARRVVCRFAAEALAAERTS